MWWAGVPTRSWINTTPSSLRGNFYKSVHRRAALPTLFHVHMQPDSASGDRQDRAEREIRVDQDLPLADRQLIVRQALRTEQQDAEGYLRNVRARFDRWPTTCTELCTHCNYQDAPGYSVRA